ncbi:MAG: peptidase C14, partial [Mesorhizobium sp.]
MRLLFAFLLMFATTAIAAAERRVALVMADDDYRLVRPLANPVNDAEAMETALKKLGFEVVVETNRDLRRMRRALDDFREDAKGADVALVYFSGHGVEISGDNRLLPVDADASSLDQLEKTS